MSRRLRLLLLGVLFVAVNSVPPASAGGCSIAALSEPVTQNFGAGSIVYQGPTADTESGVRRDLSTSTMTRLAVLSGPFQSFQASRTAVEPNCDRWLGRDKVRHAAIFFATTLGLQLFIESTFNVSKTKAFLLSAAIATTVGIGKELYDKSVSNKDCFSEQDLLANTGGILGAGFVIMISN